MTEHIMDERADDERTAAQILVKLIVFIDIYLTESTQSCIEFDTGSH